MEKRNSLNSIMRGMVPETVDLFPARVLGTQPVVLQAVGDEKHRITQQLLTIPEHLQDHTVSGDISGVENGSNVSITLRAGLRVGEIVDVLSVHTGERYYILGRRVH